MKLLYQLIWVGVLGGSSIMVCMGGPEVPKLTELCQRSISRQDAISTEALRCIPAESQKQIFDTERTNPKNMVAFLQNAYARQKEAEDLIHHGIASLFKAEPAEMVQMVVGINGMLNNIDLSGCITEIPSITVDYGYEDNGVAYLNSVVQFQQLFKQQQAPASPEQEVVVEGGTVSISRRGHDNVTFEVSQDSSVSAVYSHHNGKKIVAGTETGDVYLIDAHYPQKLVLLGTHALTKPVSHVALTHDGKIAISATLDRGCTLWGLDSGMKIRLAKLPGSVHGISVSEDDSTLTLDCNQADPITVQLPGRYLAKQLTNHEYALLALYEKMAQNEELTLPEADRDKLKSYISALGCFEDLIKGAVESVLLRQEAS